MTTLAEIGPFDELIPVPVHIWRSEPLILHERMLLQALFVAHEICAYRENMSTVCLLNAGVGSGCYANGIAAACMATGGSHAPLADTMNLLAAEDSTGAASAILATGQKVPGWGNSFIKDKPDDAWRSVDELLKRFYPDLHGKITDITKLLHKSGKLIFPNPSVYTASVACALRMPSFLAPHLFFAGRLNAWTELLWRHVQ